MKLDEIALDEAVANKLLETVVSKADDVLVIRLLDFVDSWPEKELYEMRLDEMIVDKMLDNAVS